MTPNKNTFGICHIKCSVTVIWRVVVQDSVQPEPDSPIRSFLLKLKRGISKKDVDMTQGGILRLLITFAIPLLLGNILQQLYNTVDTWVVGQYVNTNAFSAVGTVGPIINTLIGFFMGLSSGAGVVISQNYGAKRLDKVERTVHTAIAMTLVLGVIFTAVGILFTPMMLRLMQTPPEVMPEAVLYLRIYFSGVAALMVYNIGAGILRAVGDSRRPFFFLAVSAGINTVLDLVFVLVFKMGVEGVALATVIAQTISALLVIRTLAKSDTCCKLYIKKIKIHLAELKQIILVGIPAGLQMAITSFSNVFVQSYINQFGSSVMGGWTAYNKVDHFLLLPMQSLALASTTFVGQNLGVDQVQRAKKGVVTAILISVGCTAVLMIPVLFFAPQIVTFFNGEQEVVYWGAKLLRLMSPFYVLCCINQVLAGSLRGAGDSRAPMIIMLSCFVVFRQIYLFIVSNYISNTVTAIALGYPAGWLICSLVTFIYFKTTNWQKHRLVK